MLLKHENYQAFFISNKNKRKFRGQLLLSHHISMTYLLLSGSIPELEGAMKNGFTGVEVTERKSLVKSRKMLWIGQNHLGKPLLID